jgi:hypothetical protein
MLTRVILLAMMCAVLWTIFFAYLAMMLPHIFR